MPTEQQLITKLLKTIDTAVNDFSGSIPSLQRQILNDITLLVKDLDIDSKGTIKNNVKNLKTIGRIKSKIEAIVLNPDYLDEVKKFTDAFAEVAKIQNQYFTLIEKKFSPSNLLLEIQWQSINSTIESLTEAGIGANVTEEIRDLLKRNVTTGGSYQQLVSQLRNAVISNKAGTGLLERYTKQITTDALNQFSAQYSQAVSDDLSLDWFMYTGSNLTTTRQFCELLTEKKYIHKSEISKILSGSIDGTKYRINPKTDLWQGAIPGTNKSNFQINRGGFSCGHQLLPVSSAIVPQNIRERFE